MKLTNYIYIMGMALVCGSCANDYLDVVPESSAGKVTIFESAENARLAINGIGRMMYRQ